MKRTHYLWIGLMMVSLLVYSGCGMDFDPDPDELPDPVTPAENSADFTDHWLGLFLPDGETRIFKGYLADGVTPAEEYSVAISYGYHNEPNFGGAELLYFHYWTVATSIHNPPVWNPDSDLYCWVRGEDGGIWYVGYSEGDGVLWIWHPSILIFPGQLPDVGDTWGEWDRVVGHPNPTSEITWSHRLESVNATVATDQGTFDDCFEIYNRRDSRMEYWSYIYHGMIAWRQVLDEDPMTLGRWNKITLSTNDPNWHATYFNSN